MRLTLETTMMSGIQLILNAILLKETVRRITGNIIYIANGLTNHIAHLMIDPLNVSLVCVASFTILPITAKLTLLLYEDISSQIKL
jgi:hypothetical protein